MNVVKNIIGYILSFIGVCLIVLLVTSSILKITVLNKEYIKEIFTKNDYYKYTSESITNSISSYMVSTGFTDVILKDIYTEEEVKNEINLFLDQIYSGEVTNIDDGKVRERLESNINSFLQEHNLEVINQKYIKEFVDNALKIYQNEISFYSVPKQIINVFIKIKNIVDKLFIISSIGVIIDLIIILICKFKNKASIFIASGLIILFFLIVLEMKIDVDNILLISSYFSNVIKDIYKNITMKILYIGIIFLCIGIIISVFDIFMENKVKKIKNS